MADREQRTPTSFFEAVGRLIDKFDEQTGDRRLDGGSAPLVLTIRKNADGKIILGAESAGAFVAAYSPSSSDAAVPDHSVSVEVEDGRVNFTRTD